MQSAAVRVAGLFELQPSVSGAATERAKKTGMKALREIIVPGSWGAGFGASSALPGRGEMVFQEQGFTGWGMLTLPAWECERVAGAVSGQGEPPAEG